jgi:hypothetical protein
VEGGIGRPLVVDEAVGGFPHRSGTSYASPISRTIWRVFERTTPQNVGLLCFVVAASQATLWAGDGPSLESTIVCMA